jgi:hypothetical protein
MAPPARQLFLELVDLVVGAHPVGFGAEAFDALDQHAAVPGTVEDGDGRPFARQMAPEAPQVGLRAFLLGRRGDRHDAVLARIQRAGDATDGAALAGRVHALEHQISERSPNRGVRVSRLSRPWYFSSCRL